MMRRAAKLLSGVGLVLGVWALTAVGPRQRSTWARPVNGPPGPVRILRFYANKGTVEPGQSALLCYGVENARTVRISPPIANLFPASQRCLEVVPTHTTHYTIWAEGFDGRVAMQSLTVPVEPVPSPPRHLNFAIWLRSGR